jgi:23S rRNA pseudouridine2605 synthase
VTELHDGERLQKVLARAGVASRRVIEDYLADGRITVNGEVAVLGRRIDPDSDTVALDGSVVSLQTDAVYYLLHKPAGVVTTVSDPEGRPTVVELVPDTVRVFPVGRLDFETEGLLLLTNDGSLTHRLTHPSFGVDKEYLAHVEGEPGRAALRALREGVPLDDGVTAPARVSAVAPDLLKIVIHEGKNRQVRRMCEAVGHPVKRLVRTRIGPLVDRRLDPGEWRELTRAELLELDRAVEPVTPTDDGTETEPPDRSAADVDT